MEEGERHSGRVSLQRVSRPEQSTRWLSGSASSSTREVNKMAPTVLATTPATTPAMTPASTPWPTTAGECQINDDYKAKDPAKPVCHRPWDGSANGGAGGYMPSVCQPEDTANIMGGNTTCDPSQFVTCPDGSCAVAMADCPTANPTTTMAPSTTTGVVQCGTSPVVFSVLVDFLIFLCLMLFSCSLARSLGLPMI